MKVSVENVSGAVINDLSTAEDGVATGAARNNPLPYPFDVPANISADGSLANSTTITLVMHPRDFHKSKSVSPGNGDGMEPGEQWNQMVNAGTVTFTAGAQADDSDREEEFLGSV